MLYNRNKLVINSSFPIKDRRRKKMKAMVEQILFDRGTTTSIEDGFFHLPPFMGVWDGFSAPHSPSHPPILFNGKTGGQMVKDIILEFFTAAEEKNATIERLAKKTNAKIKKFQEDAGLSIKDASQLAGATFAFAHIKDDCVDILQGGDCYALWLEKSGKTGITKNLFRSYENSLREKITKLMIKAKGNRQVMWDLFYPILCESRRRITNVPGKNAVLNGQPRVSKCWQKLSLPNKKLKTLLLFTDGMVPHQKTDNETYLAQKVMKLYEQSGLRGILQWTRSFEVKKANRSHQTFGEATAIAIKF